MKIFSLLQIFRDILCDLCYEYTILIENQDFSYSEEASLAQMIELEDLNIDDILASLTEEVKQATVRDLFKSRSGVYHPGIMISQLLCWMVKIFSI